MKNAILKMQVENVLEELMVATDTDNVVVDHASGKTLTTELAGILATVADLPAEGVTAAIDARINALVNGAPAAYDTLKEIADYIAAHGEVTETLNAAITAKVDKESGKGLSANDFTDALKSKLDALDLSLLPTAAQQAQWNALRGVRYGASAPADLKTGELFVQILS